MCDLAANVVCPGLGGDGSCTHPDGSGDVDHPASCASFAFCDNGVLGAVETCPAGLHFNPVSGACDLPENLVEPCVDTTAAVNAAPRIPTAPSIKHATTFKDRVMRKLHLRH